jgi:single-strand DNA-binding protein
MYNKIILVGNLTREVELKALPGGSDLAIFGLATNKKWKDQNGEDRQEVMFIDISVFGKMAGVLNQYLSKGSKVLIEGRLVLEQWEKDGQKRSRHKIIADTVQFMDTKSSSQGGQHYQTQSGFSVNAQVQNADENLQEAAASQSSNEQVQEPSFSVDSQDIPF